MHMHLPLIQTPAPLKSSRFRIRRRNVALRLPDLPLELQFLILDELEDEVLELRELCFVCRAWGTHTQRLLFRTVWVTPANVERLFAVIQAKPKLGHYVRKLQAVCKRYFSMGPEELVLEELIQRLPELMPDVRTLDLLGWKGEPSIQSVGNLAGITHLRIRPVTFRNAYNMFRFIALFPRIDSLDVFWQDINPDSHSVHAPTPPAPRRLKYLGLSNNPASASGVVVAWLSQSGTIAVEELRLTEYDSIHGGMDELLRKIGDSLQHLHLLEVPHWFPTDSVRRGSLPPFASLQTLKMSLCASTTDSINMRARLLAVLHDLSSPHLCSMHFDTYVLSARGHVELPWNEVDDALSAFTGLREVIFDMYGQFDYSGAPGSGHAGTAGVGRERPLGYRELCDELRGKMVRSSARGILQFRLAGRKGVIRDGRESVAGRTLGGHS
ncbi:hypothetical protein C8R43DRAFT_1139049 [Mycena crocata]|nr:hypothetical protein C8R43DRAFT_1139049 [Mycena crocata]